MRREDFQAFKSNIDYFLNEAHFFYRKKIPAQRVFLCLLMKCC